MDEELNYDKLSEMIARCQWTFAKTMPFAPHEYIVRDKCPLTDEEFVYFVEMQRRFGVKERWGKNYNSYLYIGDYKYWTMGAPIEETKVMNRANVNVIKKALWLCNEMVRIKKDVESKQPHQVNTIFDLKPSEIAVSKILAGFFCQRIKGKYQVLDSFVKYTFGEELASMIDKPIIIAEDTVEDKKRIDILVFEKGKYAIVFENKIWDAEEQDKQLANYIKGMKAKEYGFEDNQIYIVYLPSTDEHGPTDKSWNKSLQKIFLERYKSLSFKDGIIGWLKSDDLQKIDDECFAHSRLLFVDYLKRVFNLTETNNMENQKIDEFICKELGLNDSDISGGISKLTGAINEINECVKQLERMRKDYLYKVVDTFSQQLEEQYNELPILKTYKYAQYICTGIAIPYKDKKDAIYILIGYEGNNLIYGATYNPTYAKYVGEMREAKEISRFYLINGGEFKKGVDWLFFKGTTIEEGYDCLKNLIERVG